MIRSKDFSSEVMHNDDRENPCKSTSPNFVIMTVLRPLASRSTTGLEEDKAQVTGEPY